MWLHGIEMRYMMQIADIVYQTFVTMQITKRHAIKMLSGTKEGLILIFLNTNVLILLIIKIPDIRKVVTKKQGANKKSHPVAR